jgi:hypothetical protein
MRTSAGVGAIVVCISILVLLDYFEIFRGPMPPNTADVNVLMSGMSNLKVEMDQLREDIDMCHKLIQQYHTNEIVALSMVQDDVIELQNKCKETK